MAERAPAARIGSPALSRPAGHRACAFHLVNIALMFAIVVAGFWPYFSGLGRDAGARPLAVHLHGLVFSGWMVLLAAQALLVFVRRTGVHRRAGSWGFGYGVVVIAMGIVATIVAPAVHVARGEWTLDTAAAFVILPIGDMVLFSGLLWAAFASRRRPEAHKRYIVLATVALLFAPAARLMEPVGLLGIAAVWLAPVLLAAAHDLWTAGRVHPVYLTGTAVLLVAFARVLVAETEAWLRVGRALVNASMPLAAVLS